MTYPTVRELFSDKR